MQEDYPRGHPTKRLPYRVCRSIILALLHLQTKRRKMRQYMDVRTRSGAHQSSRKGGE